MPAGRKMPHTKCRLPSHSHNTNIIRLISGPRHKFQRTLQESYSILSTQKQEKRNRTIYKHIWTLNDNNKPFTIKWRVLKQCKPYNSISNKCNLCLFEKYVIICKKNLCSLNKRNELSSSCPHRSRYLLKNFVVK